MVFGREKTPRLSTRRKTAGVQCPRQGAERNVKADRFGDRSELDTLASVAAHRCALEGRALSDLPQVRREDFNSSRRCSGRGFAWIERRSRRGSCRESDLGRVAAASGLYAALYRRSDRPHLCRRRSDLGSEGSP